jgi:hypothetical protein
VQGRPTECTFVAGPLQLNAKQAEGLDVNVYAPQDASKNAGDFANAVARSVTAFSDLFGPLPDPYFTVVQMPDGGLREFSGPGCWCCRSALGIRKSMIE